MYLIIMKVSWLVRCEVWSCLCMFISGMCMFMLCGFFSYSVSLVQLSGEGLLVLCLMCVKILLVLGSVIMNVIGLLLSFVIWIRLGWISGFRCLVVYLILFCVKGMKFQLFDQVLLRILMISVVFLLKCLRLMLWMWMCGFFLFEVMMCLISGGNGLVMLRLQVWSFLIMLQLVFLIQGLNLGLWWFIIIIGGWL